MARILPYLLAAALSAALALSIALSREVSARKDAEAVSERLSRSVAVLEKQRDDAALARDLAQAELQRIQAAAAEYEQIKSAFRNGDFNAPLPDEFRNLLDRLLHGPR